MRAPRVALVQAPVFLPAAPPGALALLSAHLKAAGVTPRLHDASREICLELARAKGVSAETGWAELGGVDAWAALRETDGRLLDESLDRQARALAAGEPDVAGFSVLTGSEAASLELAGRLKRLSPRTLVVFGGPQCLRETEAFALAARPEVDAVALGEADRSFVSFVRALTRSNRAAPRIPGFLVKDASGAPFDCGDGPEVEDLDSLPYLDFKGFAAERYPPSTLYLSSSRGCVRRCLFCTHIVQQKVFRLMSAPRVAAEIRRQLELRPDVSFVEFGDSLVNGSVERLAELSDRLAELRLDRAAAGARRDLAWGGMAIIHRTMTSALLARLRRGGCRMLFYGLESGSQKVVDLMRKGFAVEDASDVLRRTKEAGISPGVFLLVGFPGETERDFQRTLAFVERNAPWLDAASLSVCEIQKGSELDARAAQLGVETPVVDRRRWRSADGSNDDAVRQDRLRRLQERLDTLGVPRARQTTRVLA